MTRRIRRLAAALALLLPGAIAAQSRPIVEIGTNLGLTLAKTEGGATVKHFGIPGQGILGQPTLYATFFAGRSLAIEPQLALNVISSGGETATTFGLGAQAGFFVRGVAANSSMWRGTPPSSRYPLTARPTTSGSVGGSGTGSLRARAWDFGSKPATVDGWTTT